MLQAMQNSVGAQLRRIRISRGLSQEALAGICQRNGWNVTRETIARIEAKVRRVSDFELLLLAENLEVSVTRLLPQDELWDQARTVFLKRYAKRLEETKT
jgi:transcriptional regulator with XRE-family HTH domain